MPKLENYRELMDNIQRAAKEENLEALFYACEAYFKADGAREEHPLVKQLLQRNAEMCSLIAFNYYASFK
jgi:hypothetical protein